MCAAARADRCPARSARAWSRRATRPSGRRTCTRGRAPPRSRSRRRRSTSSPRRACRLTPRRSRSGSCTRSPERCRSSAGRRTSRETTRDAQRPPSVEPSPSCRSASDELLELALERLLDDPAGVRVARQGHRELLGLLELDVRRQRRHLRVGDRLVDDEALGGERLIPRGADLVGMLDPDPLRPDDLRIAGEVEVGKHLRGVELWVPGITRCSQVTWLRSLLCRTTTTHCLLLQRCWWCARSMSAALPIICIAPSPIEAMTGRSG